MGEARAGMDFQEDLREVDPGEQREDLLPEGEQAGGLLQFVEPGQRQRIAAVDGFDPHGRVGRQVGRGPLIRGLQLLGQGLEAAPASQGGPRPDRPGGGGLPTDPLATT